MVEPSRRTTLIFGIGVPALLVGIGILAGVSTWVSVGAMLTLLGVVGVVGGGISWYVDHEAANARRGVFPYRLLRRAALSLADRFDALIGRAYKQAHLGEGKAAQISRRDYVAAHGGSVFRDSKRLHRRLERRGVKHPDLDLLLGGPEDGIAPMRKRARVLREIAEEELHWWPPHRSRNLRSPR